MKIEAVSPAVTTTLGSHACLLVIRVRTRYPHCHYLASPHVPPSPLCSGAHGLDP